MLSKVTQPVRQEAALVTQVFLMLLVNSLLNFLLVPLKITWEENAISAK